MLAHVALAFILFSALFLSLLPTILFIKYFRMPASENILWFIFETFLFMLGLMFISCTSIVFVPAIIFRVFRIAPREGEYELDVRNKEIFKWIIAQGLYKISMIVGQLSAFSRRLVNQLFGAKVERGVIFQGSVTDPYFLEVGEHTIIGGGAKIFTHIADKPRTIIFKRVKIGKYCLLGYNVIIMPGAVLDDFVIVGANTLVPKNRYLERGIWVGTPAKKIKDIPTRIIQQPEMILEDAI